MSVFVYYNGVYSEERVLTEFQTTDEASEYIAKKLITDAVHGATLNMFTVIVGKKKTLEAVSVATLVKIK